MPTLGVIQEAYRESIRRALSNYQERDMNKSYYMYSKITLDGSDDVDELVRQCGGNYHQAQDILFGMLSNYLHFNQMQKEKDLGALHRLQCEQRHIREDIQAMAWAPELPNMEFLSRVKAKLERLRKNDEDIARLAKKVGAKLK